MLVSRRKLKTWVYLRLRLVRPYVHLHWIAMTCAHFGRDHPAHYFLNNKSLIRSQIDHRKQRQALFQDLFEVFLEFTPNTILLKGFLVWPKSKKVRALQLADLRKVRRKKWSTSIASLRPCYSLRFPRLRWISFFWNSPRESSRCAGQGTTSIDEKNHFVQEGDRVVLLDLPADWSEKYVLANQREGFRTLLELAVYE